MSDGKLDLEKMRSIGHLSRGRTRNQVTEGRDGEGQRFKATRDELGNTVTERGNDRQDVTINAPRVRVEAKVKEDR